MASTLAHSNDTYQRLTHPAAMHLSNARQPSDATSAVSKTPWVQHSRTVDYPTTLAAKTPSAVAIEMWLSGSLAPVLQKVSPKLQG